MRKIKVGIVNYLNTKPLLFGIEHSSVNAMLELVADYPSNIAQMLMDDKIDVGLVPVTVIPRLDTPYIITDYCIGCDGPVASVALFSEMRLDNIKEVLLDYQSHTSVALARILLREYWKKEVTLTDTKDDFRFNIRDSTAGLLIGDRALQQRNVSPYIYDLGEAWKNFTGLPFVFAAWVSNKVLDEEFIAAFNAANQLGLNSIDKVVAETNCGYFDLNKYYTRHISYRLDSEKKKGMEVFFRHLAVIAT